MVYLAAAQPGYLPVENVLFLPCFFNSSTPANSPNALQLSPESVQDAL
jgi:hypothetical protein